jgi:copper transport protein
VLWILIQALPVAAHAFLIQSEPAAGQHLAHSPAQVSLLFTETVLPPRADRVALSIARGRPVRIGPLVRSDGGTRLTAEVPHLAPGVYLVRWQVVSAVDGHYTAGSFAFAVGPIAGAIPTARTTSPPDWPLAFDSWVFVVALALSLGGVANRLWVWRPISRGATLRPDETWTWTWPVMAVAGAARVMFIAWSAAGGTTLRALAGTGTWLTVVHSASGMWSILALSFAVYAWILDRRRRVLVAVFASLVLSSLALAMMAHPSSSPYGWARVAIEAHVALALLWAGMLAQLAVETGALVRQSSNPGPILKAALTRYSSGALVLVAGTVLSGAVTALGEIRSPYELTATLYGQVLLAKGLLAGAALLFAWYARRALGSAKSPDFVRIRRYMRPEAVALVAVLGASALLANVAPPAPRPAPALAASLLGPPPAGFDSLTLAGQAGWLEVFLTAAPKTLTLQVVTSESMSPGGARLLAADAPGGNAVYLSGPGIPKSPLLLVLRSCGGGCYTAPFTWPDGITHVNIDAVAPGWSGGRLSFSVMWPPGPRAAGLWHHVLSDMGREPTIVLDETVVTGPGAIAQNVYHLNGTQWLASLPYSKAVPDVRLLSTQGGVRQVIVYLPASRIWARVWLSANGTFVREVIIDQGHKIVHAYTY